MGVTIWVVTEEVVLLALSMCLLRRDIIDLFAESDRNSERLDKLAERIAEVENEALRRTDE